MPRESKKKIANAALKKDPDKLYVCSCCGREWQTGEKHFYKNSHSRNYESNDGYVTICIKCAGELFDDYKSQFNDQKLACMIMCAKFDYPFYHSLYESVAIRNDKFVFGQYIRQVNCTQYAGKTFATTLASGELDKTVQESVEDYEEDWSVEDRRTKNEVIKLLGKDPFVGYVPKDRKYLFNEFLQYLDDEDLLADQYKVSQLIQLLNNNNQINQYDVALSKLDPIRSVEDIKSLSSLKKDLVASNEKIAKENGFSVKSRGGAQVGKGTLTGLMRDMRDRELDVAEVNFYDQLRSPASQWAIDISMKSMMENIQLDEIDINEIVENQRNMIVNLQNENDDLKEEKRILKVAELEYESKIEELKEQLKKLGGDIEDA